MRIRGSFAVGKSLFGPLVAVLLSVPLLAMTTVDADTSLSVAVRTNFSGSRVVLLNEIPSTITPSHRLQWGVDAFLFFKDNEFVAEKVYGSTFPGFRLTPRLVYAPLRDVALEAGVNMLYFWGADRYPVGIYAPPAALYTPNSATPLLLTPWLRMRWDFNTANHLIIGSLYNNRNHDLPLALYNDEWAYVSRPEAGVQWLSNGKYLNADIWLNWQQYIFFNSPQQEQFIAGASLRGWLLNQADRWQLSVPLHFVGKHYGGEFTDPDMSVLSIFNYAAGLSVRRNLRGDFRYAVAESYLMGCHHTANLLSPYADGWGVLSTVATCYRQWHVSLSHWVSEGFYTIMGSPHFNNVSEKFLGMTMNRMHEVVAKITYAQYRLPWASLHLEGSWIHYFPWTGNLSDGDTFSRQGSDSFSFGVSLRFCTPQSLIGTSIR